MEIKAKVGINAVDFTEICVVHVCMYMLVLSSIKGLT